MSHKATEVLSCFEAFGVEAVGINREATEAAISVVNSHPQRIVVGAQAAQCFAKQVAPFCGQLAPRDGVDFDPGVVTQS